MIEINCGCPSPNSLGRFAGSGMLRDPEAFARAIELLAQRMGPGRLAVKMRLGIESEQEFPALLRAISSLDLARLTVHARTRQDAYRAPARWEQFALATASARAPVHASGDVWGFKSWERLITQAPGLSGAMIGRGLIRNPWIFGELRDGRTRQLTVASFCQALFAFLLLHELALTRPERLFNLLEKGRIGGASGEDFAAWEKPVVALTEAVFGVPFLLLKPESLRGRAISPQAFSRLRWMWTYLRSSLADELAPAGLMKCKDAASFFALFWSNAEEEGIDLFAIGHRPETDAQFSGLRG